MIRLNRLFRNVVACTLGIALSALPVVVQAKEQDAAASSVVSTAPVVLPVPAGPVLHPALWLVRDEDTTIYLFGTVHLLKPGLAWLQGPVADALARSDVLVTEVLKSPDGDVALQAAVLDLALLPQGQSLRSLMKPEQQRAFEALLAREGLPVSAFDRYEPWYPALVLSMMPLIKQGMQPDMGVEAQLFAAHGARRSEALESARYQIELFDTLSQTAQLDYLASVVAHYDEIAPQMDGLVAAWGKGDAEKIGTELLAATDTPEVADALIRNRNRAWAAWIVKRLERPGTLFVAVGAGHLAGPESVQTFLGTAGVKTERVQ